MSIKTIYTCDKCAASLETNEQFWEVGVIANNLHLVGEYGFSITRQVVNEHFRMQVCRPCLESMGIHAVDKKANPEPTPLTLEDLIIDIVRNNKDRL